MNLKAIALPVCLAFGLGAIYFLPSAGAVANTAIRMTLPEEESGWYLTKIPPSKEELEILASDTEFSKANCLKPRIGEFTEDGRRIADQVSLSIVLSGYDLNNSIHRPERCMPSQGHNIMSGSDVPITLANGRTLTARRLISTQQITTSADQRSSVDLQCVTYYFFVGHDKVAHGHMQRTMIDLKDRLLYGMDQRWAYASFSMWYGKMPGEAGIMIPEAEADQKVQDFIKNFAEKQIDWAQMKP